MASPRDLLRDIGRREFRVGLFVRLGVDCTGGIWSHPRSSSQQLVVDTERDRGAGVDRMYCIEEIPSATTH